MSAYFISGLLVFVSASLGHSKTAESCGFYMSIDKAS